MKVTSPRLKAARILNKLKYTKPVTPFAYVQQRLRTCIEDHMVFPAMLTDIISFEYRFYRRFAMDVEQYSPSFVLNVQRVCIVQLHRLHQKCDAHGIDYTKVVLKNTSFSF